MYSHPKTRRRTICPQCSILSKLCCAASNFKPCFVRFQFGIFESWMPIIWRRVSLFVNYTNSHAVHRCRVIPLTTQPHPHPHTSFTSKSIFSYFQYFTSHIQCAQLFFTYTEFASSLGPVLHAHNPYHCCIHRA